MRNVLFLLTIGLIAPLVMVTCDSSHDEPEGALESFSFVKSNYIWCCDLVCGQWISMKFRDDAPAAWYWMSLKKNGQTEVNGRAKYVSNPDETIYDTIDCHYYEGLEAGTYEIYLYRCTDPQDIGNSDGLKPRAGPEEAMINQNFDTTLCLPYCCTGKHFYSQAQLYGIEATGISARITTRWGELCNECDTTTRDAHYLAGVAVRCSTAYAETGYRYYRHNHSDFYGWFAAVGSYGGGQEVYVHQPPLVPAEGSTPKYELSLDVSTGTWSFYYEGQSMSHDTEYDTAWVGKYGETAIWMGEIQGHESDMPGTQNAPCYFSECRYYDGISWYWPNFFSPLASVRPDDPKEWAASRVTNDSSKFYIYDKRPLTAKGVVYSTGASEEPRTKEETAR